MSAGKSSNKKDNMQGDAGSAPDRSTAKDSDMNGSSQADTPAVPADNRTSRARPNTSGG